MDFQSISSSKSFKNTWNRSRYLLLSGQWMTGDTLERRSQHFVIAYVVKSKINSTKSYLKFRSGPGAPCGPL